jgi:hypothetical protein
VRNYLAKFIDSFRLLLSDTHTHTYIYVCVCICRVSQEERSIFWEVIISAIISKKFVLYICPIPNGF